MSNSSQSKSVRIASGHGFWGDWLEAPIHQIRKGPIDYLMLDYLAEVTMSILMKQKLTNPELGYAQDFVDLLAEILPDIVKKKVTVLANAGGVNPEGCARAVRAIAESLGLSDSIKIACISGDNIASRLDQLVASGHKLENMETGESVESIADRLLSANAYVGASPIVEALGKGANIVITGRVTDTALALGPMIHEFGWEDNDWDKLASGVVAGHIIECGAQASGGNCSVDWQEIDFATIGLPIVEMLSDGSFVVTKHAGTGGRVDIRTITEQLVYEIGDPKSFMTPDVIVDFTTIKLKDLGDDRVCVTEIKGHEPTNYFKVSASYSAGYKAVGTLVYSWPDAYKKAKVAAEVIKKRLENMSLEFDEIHESVVGVNACWGSMTEQECPDLPEAMLRIGVRGQEKDDVKRFTCEIAPLVLTGPPTATGYAGGRPRVERVVAYWPALIAKSAVKPVVNIL